MGDYFAPWVQALALKVEGVGPDSVTLRLPHSDQLSRVGGMVCGQAMMAAADTAMVLALIRHFGRFRPCTTVQLSSSFLKPLSGQDALVEARVLRAGKAMAFGEIDLRGATDGKSVCRASTMYALL
jgi:acyl-coenzyme A thioesterase PaaI-like protein